MCVLVLCGHPTSNGTVLIGDTKQAMGEGKSGPVETGLTGPAAMALGHCVSLLVS